ncbi:Glycosyltransferase involved in cell wall bisynthesis [Geoalkalibacter ferrihydriticus]|uniref:Glycosyl transferase n=2 Tax=Geoalkalibacter ferrihydriticus TaxID=392333 RepID=A0A0C2HSV5_9BACT|nr:glycosyltransferase family 2 protein [Geoalkalibacter ferrihydriticus]KIH75862.1 glycosyl transferase [Geoalkalibacter ferrihydriticus DSM 17813]SDM86023.1 Glycosyltransferase involved in cell wall bisynthesis [Geoalkalibacter ferrihydriticus]
MKLIVQIPCFNEEQTLPETVADIPRSIAGISAVEILVIDDGSTDQTVQVARDAGVDHIIQNRCNMGLARSFQKGLDACLQRGADIIVNTDGDNQYCGADIPKLIAPILEGRADLVIGNRQTDSIPHFSANKKRLQKLGSFIVRRVSGTEVADAVSGFRAMTRETALRLNVVSSFSYTIETVIQAGKKNIAIASVPVRTNPKTRESRLYKGLPRFLERSVTTMVRIYTMYQPLRFFSYLGLICIGTGLIPSVRFLFYYLAGQGEGHVQSLILAAILFIMGFQFLVAAMITDVVSRNRQLLEETLMRVRRMEIDRGKDHNGQ